MLWGVYPLEKPVVAQLIKKFLALKAHGTSFIIQITRVQTWICVLSQTNLDHTFQNLHL
jgi:hypothetical protein